MPSLLYEIAIVVIVLLVELHKDCDMKAEPDMALAKGHKAQTPSLVPDCRRHSASTKDGC